ncbi:tyrosine-type recombinase/integrase [Polaribacter cellanae]|uniref:Tyrosine-type recombinase/integrase n=1 Tax=Polaribacter cellanae TaxID=2818493 RepID=A0A975H567_9FLAO|nr:tyrosine-type recombinase/integrase [Polaribacter cellanae]QTE21091.1 tyrosine-type recombinase/integrase [Polaribacter cellanae]
MKKLPLKSTSFITLIYSYTEWLDVLGYASSTVYNLPNHLKEFFYYLEQKGHKDISLITTQIVKEYYNHLSNRKNQRRGGGISKAFLNKHQQALKLFLKYLKEHKSNIKFGVHLKGEKTNYQESKTILTQEEVKELFEACNFSHMAEHFQLRDKAILVLLYSCGLRRNEAVHINTEDILFEKQRIYVRKGKNYKERFVPINKYNLNVLEEYIFEARSEFLKNYQTDALLLSNQGRRISDLSIANRLKEIINATENETIQEKPITLHTLRHSIATHLMQNKVPIKSISTFLGHASLESTQIYVHLVKKEAQLKDDV